MVALVRKSVEHIWDVRGKRFCHPGIATANDWTKSFSTVSINFFLRSACPKLALDRETAVVPEPVSRARSAIYFQYFEDLMIPRECDSNKTLLENRVHALSDYFEMACVPGPWSSDVIFDNQLSTY